MHGEVDQRLAGLHQLDQWVLSELQFTVRQTRDALDAYDISGASVEPAHWPDVDSIDGTVRQ